MRVAAAAVLLTLVAQARAALEVAAQVEAEQPQDQTPHQILAVAAVVVDLRIAR